MSNIIVRSQKSNDSIPKKDNKLSAKANRSKKKVKGKVRYKIEAIRAIEEFKKREAKIKRTVSVPAPAKTEIRRPAISGSLINLRSTEFNHINNGCLPSVRGIKRRVSTFLIS